MRRLWISVGILLFLLGGSLFNAWYAKELTGGMEQRLRLAQQLTEQDQWEQALVLTQEVYDQWESRHFYLHATMRHSDTDQILRGFRTVMEYLRLQGPDQYNAANADLITQLELLAEMEQPSVVNVL